MEETVVKPGILTKLFGGQVHEDEEYMDERPLGIAISAVHQYSINVRRQVVSFQDAIAAADGLKRGEQQILNLNYVQPDLREKIKDFLCGVQYTAEASWTELGENIYLLAPASAQVEVSSSENKATLDFN